MKQVYTDVPESDVTEVEAILVTAGATEVVKEPQGDGLWTLIGTYPEDRPATMGELPGDIMTEPGPPKPKKK